ncbi:MAG: A/G-specific adenine glycosylase [Proteobacteria bacterium]|nr:A/G-specific adenine glycosylase [Pseudomonadota bacterium]
MNDLEWFVESLRAWFAENGRDLPWRHAPTPYEVWVSELMLQQTQVITVIPYYEHWLKRFPDIAALANAPIDEVLTYWAGLGYYRRARYLHEGAKKILTDFDGQFPQSIQELRSIPGIGAYTAGAIASFAFHQNVPAVDGNAHRVLARFFGIAGDLTSGEPAHLLDSTANQVAAIGYASVVNQAVMDIGASCCSKAPQCNVCPLAERCYAMRNGLTDAIPFKKKRVEKYDEFRAALRLTCDDNVLIARRRSDILLGGLWEFPMITISRGKGAAHRRDADLQMRLPRTSLWQSFLASVFPTCPLSDLQTLQNTVSHTFTHIEMKVALDCAQCAQMPEITGVSGDYDAFQWVREISSQFAISSLMKKLMALKD